jgi:D-arginine dehydrogenase
VRLAGGEELRAERVVLAAGGWAGRLGQRAGSRVALEPTRRHLLVTEADARVDPRWPVVWVHGQPFYCRPESGGLMISACDQVAVDPDACAVDPAVLATIAESTARFMPRFAAARAAHAWCGMRTMTADGRFAVGPDPDLAGLFWVAGLGGHGMVAGAEVGRIAAELLIHGPAGEPLAGALDPARLVATAV